MIAIIVGYSGPIDAGEKSSRHCVSLASPQTRFSQCRMLHSSRCSTGLPPGRLHYWKSNYTSS